LANPPGVSSPPWKEGVDSSMALRSLGELQLVEEYLEEERV